MPDSTKQRLDLFLVEGGYVKTREKAKGLIMAGKVFVSGQRLDKPGTLVPSDASIEVKGDENPFVSRGGLKLEKAVSVFNFPISGRVYMDIGASTGGFTHCLLMHGATSVFAIDVGYGQLAWELRQDSRVFVMERTNIRYVRPEHLDLAVNGATIDVSFISLRMVLPVVFSLLVGDSHVIALIKPQFEAGRGKVGKKGVVRDLKLHQEILLDLLPRFEAIGFTLHNLNFSPITGPKGNIEFLCHLYKPGKSLDVGMSIPGAYKTPEALNALVIETVESAHRDLKSR